MVSTLQPPGPDSAEVLRLLYEHAELGLAVFGPDSRLLSHNRRFADLTGLRPDETTARRPLAELMRELLRRGEIRRSRDDARRQRDWFRRAGDASPVEQRRSDGRTIEIRRRRTAGGGAVVVLADISRLKDAERQLAEQSRLLALTLETLHEGVFTTGPDGRAQVWNHRLLELLALPSQLLDQRPTIEDVRRFQVNRGDFEHDPVFSDIERRRTVLDHYRRRTHDGRVLEVDSRKAGDGCQVRIYRDVTADVRAAEALHQSEQRFRTMADAAPALIWQGAADGQPQWFNQRWLAFTGHSLQDEVALPWSARMHPDDIERCRAIFAQALEKAEPFEVEYRLLCADGRERWIADHGRFRFGADGRIEGIDCYGWDITERRAEQLALAAARDEAERLSRAKSDFLSRMSHELRTPLNAVLGFAQLLVSDPADPLTPHQHERVLELQRGGTHLLQLINDVLDLARIEAGGLRLQLQAVDLCSLVRECSGLVASLMAQHGVRLEVLREPGCRVWADPTRLKQVLLNLLSNAAKYNRRGGLAQLSWSSGDGRVRFSVRDEGPGLTAQQQAQLFSPFERLGAAAGPIEGTGIGLAISKWLVERMGGQIGVTSTPGAGSEFWFELAEDATADIPAAPEPAPAPASRPALAPSAGRCRVLYIEDNEVNRLLMQGMLALRPAIDLHLAALPEEGLAMARAAPPSLVLLDIQLPGIDGFEVLARLRADETTARIPVVAVSANAMPADLERAMSAGFQDYVTKPIDLERMLAVIDRWLPS